MSQNFINFIAVPYAGQIPQAQPVGLCGPNQKGNVVPITINWNDYPTGVIDISLQAGANVKPGLDQIRSIAIDNTFCSISTFVQFPDTNFVVAAEADTVVSGFVLTNQLNFRIFNQSNLGGTPTPQQTRIFLCDFIIDTFTQENIQRSIALWIGTTPTDNPNVLNYSSPALGRVTSAVRLNLDTLGYANGLNPFQIPPPVPILGTYIITSLEVSLLGVYTDTAFAKRGFLAIGNSIQNAFGWGFLVENNINNYQHHTIERRNSLNVALDAITDWRFFNNGVDIFPGGIAELQITYDWVGGAFVI